MLAIGRGLMAEPRLLILDEPSLGLSPLLVEELFALIRQLRDDGLAVLLVETGSGSDGCFSSRLVQNRSRCLATILSYSPDARNFASELLM